MFQQRRAFDESLIPDDADRLGTNDVADETKSNAIYSTITRP